MVTVRITIGDSMSMGDSWVPSIREHRKRTGLGNVPVRSVAKAVNDRRKPRNHVDMPVRPQANHVLRSRD